MGYNFFVLLFQCETCKTTPVGFLVKRFHCNLTLAGRTPIETVFVSKILANNGRLAVQRGQCCSSRGKYFGWVVLSEFFHPAVCQKIGANL
jgi:hypothetical protein